MKSPLSDRTRTVINLCALFTLTICLACVAQAQEIPMPSAPPPMKFVSHPERAQLISARDYKARTRASIELAESRLRRAEELTTGLQYDAAASELGCYQGLIEDAMSYLNSLPVDKSKMRDLFKRLELTLRAHGARLESIRRSTPVEYSVNIKTITDYTRTARTEALNCFYGDTVMRDEPKTGTVPKGENVKAFASDSPKQH